MHNIIVAVVNEITRGTGHILCVDTGGEYVELAHFTTLYVVETARSIFKFLSEKLFSGPENITEHGTFCPCQEDKTSH